MGREKGLEAAWEIQGWVALEWGMERAWGTQGREWAAVALGKREQEWGPQGSG
jgi:hypothetical protein